MFKKFPCRKENLYNYLETLCFVDFKFYYGYAGYTFLREFIVGKKFSIFLMCIDYLLCLTEKKLLIMSLSVKVFLCIEFKLY